MSQKQSSVIHFYIEPDAISGNTATFSREESDHILKTYRLYIGDAILATDGVGNLYQMQLSEYKDRLVRATIAKTARFIGELPVKITVGFGIPQLSKADQIIDQCTQLGASGFIPLLAKNSKSRLSADKSKARLKRWRKLAIAAVKQSLRSVVPEIAMPLGIDQLVEKVSEFDLVLLGSLNGQLVSNFKQTSGAKSILLITGPEEGFSRIEEDKLIRAGATAISLGERRLRAELAPVVLTSLLAQRALEG